MKVQQGDVFDVLLDDNGGIRMAVVISSNRFNESNSQVMVVPFTSDPDGTRATFPATAMFNAASYPFLQVQSAVPAEWMDWAPRKDLDNKIGYLSANDLNRVLQAVAWFFDIQVWIDTDE